MVVVKRGVKKKSVSTTSDSKLTPHRIKAPAILLKTKYAKEYTIEALEFAAVKI